MTDKQIRFCDEYLLDCNPDAAARRSGFPPETAKAVLDTPEAKGYIKEQLQKMHNEKIADAAEVIEYLTSVMRGDMDGETAVTTRERIKAAELIGKRYGIFKDNIDLAASAKPVVISGEDKLEN